MHQKSISKMVQWKIMGIVQPVLPLFLLMAPVITVKGATTIDETIPSSFPSAMVSDWKAQDGTNYTSAIEKIKSSIPQEYADKIEGEGEDGYLNACHWRRVARIQPYANELKKILYARHHNIGGAIIGYTEELNSDGSRGLGPWGMSCISKSIDYPRSNTNTAILLLEFENFYPEPVEIIADNKGVLRDPCPSYDGKTLVYAHSKDNNGYHIWDMNLETGKKRQLTDDLGAIKVSDMEPCVLPSGDIMFQSSRCFQHVDCNVNLCSNTFLMNADGKYMRRIGYDQVSTFYPTMMSDGAVMYTRWEYNDRNVSTCFGIFTMNQDGTRQQEFYGNQTEWPATFCQARQIPNTMMAIAVIGGHQGPYAGDLVLVDASITRNGLEGIQLIAPIRTTKNTGGGMDGVPDADKLFQNPYPLDEEWFLISYRTIRTEKFSIYLMNTNGERELLATDTTESVSQPIPLIQRDKPIVSALQADYSQDKAYCSVVDVSYGMAVEGVKREEVKKIRVVAMEYRTDPAFGNTGSMGYQMSPVGRYGCSWEAKWIVGEVDVAEDGSAAFEVPPRTPLFLQLIDVNGICIQTMRSWMTLQPGERFDCMGCHEDKNAAALTVTPQAVEPVPLTTVFGTDGKAGSFYFPKVVQPVLDENCVKSGCHNSEHSSLDLTGGETFWSNELTDATNNNAFRYWTTSYWNLSQSKYVHCNAMFGWASAIPPRSIGSPRSALIGRLLDGHNDVPNEAIEVIAAWIDLGIPHSGTYIDDMSEEDAALYLQRLERRKLQEEFEKRNIEELLGIKVAVDNEYLNQPKNATSRVTTATGFRATFIGSESKLYLHLPSEGRVKVVDLQGRQILSQVISNNTFIKDSHYGIKLNVPAGTYIVKFKGINQTAEQMVSIL